MVSAMITTTPDGLKHSHKVLVHHHVTHNAHESMVHSMVGSIFCLDTIFVNKIKGLYNKPQTSFFSQNIHT